MTEVDKRIEELGFKIDEIDDVCGYITYYKKEDDQRVELYFTDDKWLILSESLSPYCGEYCDIHREPLGMTYEECKAFLDKIDELKETWKL